MNIRTGYLPHINRTLLAKSDSGFLGQSQKTEVLTPLHYHTMENTTLGKEKENNAMMVHIDSPPHTRSRVKGTSPGGSGKDISKKQ